MTTATYELMVDLNNGGTYSGATEDFSAYLRSYSLTRGRTRPVALEGSGIVAAAQFTATLYNPSGRFSPYNSSSPLSPNIVPGRSVRLRVTSGTTRTRFRGVLVDIYPQRAQRSEPPTAQLVALGLLSRLTNDTKVSPAASSGALTGTLIQAVLDLAGIASADYSLEAGEMTTSRWHAHERLAIDLIRELVLTEGAPSLLFEAASGVLTFHARHHRIETAASNTSQVTLSDDDADAGAVYYVNPQPYDRLGAIYNEITASVPQFTVGTEEVLWTLAETGVTINPGQTREFIARHPSDSTGHNIGEAYVDTWTTPVAGTDWTVSGGLASDLTLTTSYTATELPFKGSNHMRIRLTNSGAASLTLTLLQARGVPVSHANPVTLNTRDSTSRGLYGLKSYALGPWLPSSSIAQFMSDYLISQYAEPMTAIAGVTFNANRDSTHMAAALDREIGDRVTFISDEFGINAPMWIEGISETVRTPPDGTHWTTWVLSPVLIGEPASTGYAIWNTSLWNDGKVWAL